MSFRFRALGFYKNDSCGMDDDNYCLVELSFPSLLKENISLYFVPGKVNSQISTCQTGGNLWQSFTLHNQLG